MGGMDKGTICTMALRLIGSSDLASGSSGQKACELYFSQALYELLAAHDWSFARRRRVLEPEEFEEVYKLPDDCLRIIEVQGLKNWRKYGRHIHPDKDCEPEKEVALIYTSSSMANRGEVDDNVPEFTRALIVRLAAYIAPSVANDKQLRWQLEQEAQEILSAAMTHDTQQDNSNDQHPLRGLLDNSLLA